MVERIVLVGTVNNVADTLVGEVEVVIQALSSFDLVEIFLVESDSTDRSLEILSELSVRIPNFNYISFGILRDKIPDRISRIRFCRNQYVEQIRELRKTIDFEYVAVADLDGMNSALTKKGIDSSFSRDDWSAVFANQTGGYYDLLALRHPTWCPKDVLEDLRELQAGIIPRVKTKFPLIENIRLRLRYDKARKDAIYSRMHIIQKQSKWIEVDSAFGGFGIYKASVFLRHNYDAFSAQESLESEHVALNKRLREEKLAIFINPELINNRWNTYNLNRFFLIRQLRQFYWNSKLRELLSK
jgi:glycosyltransferase involved in cell wall biosynthesis